MALNAILQKRIPKAFGSVLGPPLVCIPTKRFVECFAAAMASDRDAEDWSDFFWKMSLARFAEFLARLAVLWQPKFAAEVSETTILGFHRGALAVPWRAHRRTCGQRGTLSPSAAGH